MFASKFLLNRQKIFNPIEILNCIKNFLTDKKAKPGNDFFYRLEWYRIGVSVPILVYSKQRPELVVMKEFKFLESTEITQPDWKIGDEISFSIFIHPEIKIDWESPEDSEEAAEIWLKKQLKAAGDIEIQRTGPHNTVYYEVGEEKKSFPTLTFNGAIKIKSPEKLFKISCKPIGKGAEFGCGLLFLK